MRITPTTLAEIDRICDYIPVVSTVSNIVDLFLKRVVTPRLTETTLKSRYWTHIKRKEVSRIMMAMIIPLLVPVLGSIYIFVSDYFEHKKNQEICDKAIKDAAIEEKKNIRRLAEAGAKAASQISGIAVTADQMMPAVSEDQQRLALACLGKEPQPILDLLAKGISPDCYSGGTRPLVSACQNSSVDVVERLIQHGGGVNTPDRYGLLPFGVACARGDLAIVQLLHPYIADINASIFKGNGTPMMFAASSENQEVIMFLKEKGASIVAKDEKGFDALSTAIFKKHSNEFLSLLIVDGEDLDQRKYTIETPGDIWRLISPTVVNNFTPLLYSGVMGSPETTQYLLDRSDVRSSDSQNHTILHFSVKHLALLENILAKCSVLEFVNQRDIGGATALHKAMENEQQEAALALLKAGADPFIENEDKKTPFILACDKGMDGVFEQIQQQHKDKITSEMQQQIALASHAAKARREQPPKEKKGDLISSLLGLMDTCIKSEQSSMEWRAKRIEESKVLGPIPRTGMEVIFGKINWPVY